MCAFGVGKVGEPCRSVSVLSRVGLTASPTELGGGRTQGSPVERGSEQDLCSITQLTATEHSPELHADPSMQESSTQNSMWWALVLTSPLTEDSTACREAMQPHTPPSK